MTRTYWGVRFPDHRGDRPMPNETIANKVARHVGGVPIHRTLHLGEWEAS